MDTSLRSRTLLAVAATSLLLPLAACGGDEQGTTTSTTSSTSSTSSTSTADTTSSTSPGESTSSDASASTSTTGTSTTSTSPSATTEDGADVDVNDMVTSEKAGVSFARPEGWTTIDPQTLADKSDVSPDVEAFAKQQGMTTDELLEVIGTQTDLFVVGDVEDGFADNINIVSSPGTATKAQIKSQLEGINADVSSVTDIQTAAGEAIETVYTLPAGDVTVQGRQVILPKDGGTAVITVSTTDADKAQQIAGAIADSLATR